MIKNLLNKINARDALLFELLKHGKNYIGGALIVQALSIISIPILTRLMPPEDYGIIAVFTSLLALMAIVFGLGIRGAVNTYYIEKEKTFPAFFTTNALLLWAAGIFIGGILFYSRETIAALVNLPSHLIIYAIAVAFFSATYEYVNAFLQASKQSALSSKIHVARGVLALIITIGITLVLSDHFYMGFIYSALILSCLLFLIAIRFIVKVGTLKPSKEYMTYALCFGLPIIFHLISGVILNSFDQVMVNKIIGTYEAGIYAFSYKVGAIFQIFIMGLNQAWVPVFYKKLKDKEYGDIEKTAKKYVLIVSAFGILITLLSPLIVKVLAPASYSVGLSLIPIILIGFLFQFLYFIYVNYSFYEKRTGMIAIITMICGLTNVGLNYIFLPQYGYVAAAWTTAISYGLFFLLNYINVRISIKNHQAIHLKTILIPVIIASIIIGLIAMLYAYLRTII